MALTPGTRLGPYEIVSPLGAGGMGEVYRAKDTRLNRDVAIKVLPESFASDPDRRARFEREAQAVAALSHPNVIAIFDTGVHDGQLYVVMELLEGQTLRVSSALPIRKATDIAVQIARGLGAAHGKGIVHRDLKPENVFLLDDGQVKILDFGLAKGAAGSEDPESMRAGETRTMAATDPGTVMGTVGYMAPEQVRGQAVDARADVFAFGAVLYEMVSGQRAFQRDTAADTMTAILTQDPPELSGSRPDLPPALDRIIRHCLEKNANERFQSARDVAFALEALSGTSASASTPVVTTPSRRVRTRLPWIVAAVAIVAAVLRISPWGSPAVAPPGEPMLLNVSLPLDWGWPELSPDGRRIASIGFQRGKAVIWIREMDKLQTTALAGPDDPNGLFWYPDSQSLGILGQDKLQRFALTGASPEPIADHQGGLFNGAAANTSGVVLYAQSVGPLYQRAPGGGDAVPATTLDPQLEETGHLYPTFLPDQRHFIYLALSRKPEHSAIYAGVLGSPERHLIVRTNLRALFVPGYLLFVRGTALLAQRFNADTFALSGEAQSLANNVDMFPGLGVAAVTASATGLVAYVDSGGLSIRNSQLAWFDRSGAPMGVLGEPADYALINLSPDNKQLAIGLQNPTTKSPDLWTADVALGITSPFVVTDAGEFDPEWAPTRDGRIAFTSDRDGVTAIFVKSTTGAGAPVAIAAMPEAAYAADWSADGRFLLCQNNDGTRIYTVPMNGDMGGKPTVLLESSSNKDQERFSPDGHWVAYDDNSSSGQYQVYVVAFPNPGLPMRVSTAGGVQPRWSRDGREMFYLAPDGSMMSAAIRHPSATSIAFEAPRRLFTTRLLNPHPGIEQYDVTNDGKRFIVITPPANWSSKVCNLLLNWTTRFK